MSSQILDHFNHQILEKLTIVTGLIERLEREIKGLDVEKKLKPTFYRIKEETLNAASFCFQANKIRLSGKDEISLAELLELNEKRFARHFDSVEFKITPKETALVDEHSQQLIDGLINLSKKSGATAILFELTQKQFIFFDNKERSPDQQVLLINAKVMKQTSEDKQVAQLQKVLKIAHNIGWEYEINFGIFPEENGRARKGIKVLFKLPP